MFAEQNGRPWQHVPCFPLHGVSVFYQPQQTGTEEREFPRTRDGKLDRSLASGGIVLERVRLVMGTQPLLFTLIRACC